MLKPPPELPGDGILVGYSLEHERHTAPIGFVYGGREARGRAPGGPLAHLTPILHTGGGHLLTIAPTGAGKGVSCIIPTLLRFPGPVIVIDPKGENAAVTGERRRALGQEVVVLDPMGITGTPTPSALNPLDLIDPEGPQSIDDASMLASLLTGGIERDDPRNLFWYQRGEQLLTGLIQYVATEADEEKRNLSEVRRLLNLPSDDFIEFSRNHLGRAADADVRQIAGTLINPAQEMIGSIVGMAQNSLGFLRGDLLHRSTARSTFDLDGITHGDPLSIYLVIPPDKLQSHRNLLRVWVGTLMAALMRRRAPMKHNTLFILDEAAQLGPLEQLRQAITLLRGYGLQTWSFWQDHSQLSNLYPQDWQTMYNNCRVHQAFGFTTLQAANAISELSGFHDPLEALRLDSDEMLLSVSGDETVIAQKPNYLTDPAFQGLYADNPFYRSSSERPPAPQRGQRRYRRPKRGQGQSGSPGASADEGPEDDGPQGDRPVLMSLEEMLEEYGVDADDAENGVGRNERAPGERFGLSGIEEGARDAALLVPGGLSPMVGTDVFEAAEVPGLLDTVERELGQRWHRYRTLVRWNYLHFFRQFFLCELTDGQRVPGREFVLRQRTDTRLFPDGVRPLLELVREAGLKDEAEHVVRYALFHLHFTRGRRPALRVVENPGQLAYWTGRTEEELAPFVELLRTPWTDDDVEGVRLVQGTALVGGDLCAFQVPVRPDGALGEVRLEPLRSGLGSPPAVEREVMGDAALGRIHGPWEVIPEPERGDLLAYLAPRERGGAEGGLPLLRRALPCYPGMELVRIPPWEPGRGALFLLWGGGRPWRVTAGERSALNARFLSMATVEDAILCMRIYAWLRSGDDYGIALLSAPGDLDALLEEGATLDPELRERIEATWVPMTCTREEHPEGARFRFRFTLVEDAKLLVMNAAMGTNGELLDATEDPVAEGLPVDPRRLEAARALPQLGSGEEGARPVVSREHRVPEVLGDPSLAPLHGPWELFTEEERRSLLFAMGIDAPVGEPAPSFLRRRVSCYPGGQLVRLMVRGPDGPADFIFWSGGRPEPVSREDLPRLNERFLSIRSPEDAAEYIRLFTWLRSDDSYPVTLLQHPTELAGLLQPGVIPHPSAIEAIHTRWVPLTAVEEGADEDGTPIYRVDFTLLEERKLLAMEIRVRADGALKEALEGALAEDLPVDPERLAAARALPALGRWES